VEVLWQEVEFTHLLHLVCVNIGHAMTQAHAQTHRMYHVSLCDSQVNHCTLLQS